MESVAEDVPGSGPAYWEHVFEDELIPMVLQAGTPDRLRQCLRVVVEALFRRADDAERRREFLDLVEKAIKDRDSAQAQKDTVVQILRATKEMRKERARAAGTANGERRAEAPTVPPEAVPDAAPADGESEAAGPAGEAAADDAAPAPFETQLTEAIGDHLAARLEALAADPPTDRRPPFFVHPGAADALRHEIRHHLGPVMLANRRVQGWAQHVSEEALADGSVAAYPSAPGTARDLSALWTRAWEQLVGDLDTPRNDGRNTGKQATGQAHQQNNQKGGSRLARLFGRGRETAPVEAPEAEVHHDAEPGRRCWARLCDASHPWLPLEREDIAVLTALFDADPEHLARTLYAGGQILGQEGRGEIVEGRAAAHLGDLVERNATPIADVLVAHLYVQHRDTFRAHDGRILTGFLRGLGRKAEARREALPRFHRWFGDELPT